MSKTKKILITLIFIGLISIVTLTTVLAFVLPNKTHNNHEQKRAIASSLETYYIDDLAYTDAFSENYNKISTFEINSLKGFMVLVSSNIEYDYANKTVNLYVDINIAERDLKYCPLSNFSGTFDGNGHTISGIRTSSDNDYYLGFAETNNGTIKNTKFSSAYIYMQSLVATGKTYAGVVAGKNTGTIENCIIENFTAEANRNTSYCNFGAIAGENKGTIKNCIVTGNCTLKIYTSGDKDGMTAYTWTGTDGTVTSSIFNATITITIASNKDKDEILFNGTKYTSSAESITLTTVGDGNYTSYTDAKNNIANRSTDASASSAWFQYADNRGYGGNTNIPIYLRAFITFANISFSASTGGTVSSTFITVPAEYSTVSTSSNYAYVYNQTITATANDHFSFDYWSGNTAYFKRTKINLIFSAVTLDGIQILSQTNITADYKNGSPITNVYTDLTNNKLTYTYYVDNAPKTITYNLANVDYYTVNKADNYTWRGSTSDNTYTVTITPTFKLKEYGSIWL